MTVVVEVDRGELGRDRIGVDRFQIEGNKKAELEY